MNGVPQLLLDETRLDLLRAALLEGPEAAASYRAWRQGIVLDEIDFTAVRILPLLVETINRHRIAEPDLARIKGASKQTWLDNMVRARLLTDVADRLSAAGVESTAMKGAALAARYPRLAAMRGSGDYDLLVRRSDAAKASDVLLQAGFRVAGVRMDRFAPPDFDVIHGMHFSRPGALDSIDLHWWPLPHWFDRDYVEDMFRKRERCSLAGRGVFVPRLDDHLFLSTKRIAWDDPDEILLRCIEATLLLRGSGGKLDWDRFVALCRAHRAAAKALAMLDLIKCALRMPIPEAVLDGLRSAPPEAEPAPPLPSAHPESLPGFWHELAGAPIDFAGRSVAWLSGFSFPEEDGRWNDGEFAAMAVRVTGAQTDSVTLRIEARPYFTETVRRCAFEAYGGCADVQTIELSAEEPFPAWFTVSGRPIGEADRVIILVFRFPTLYCPKSLGLNPDPRRLAVMFDRVELAPPALRRRLAEGPIDCAREAATYLMGLFRRRT